MAQPQVIIPPVGPIRPPSGRWEGYHFNRWPIYDQLYQQDTNYKWMEWTFSVLPPGDIVVNKTSMNFLAGDIFSRLAEGGPVQYACYYRANRVAGVPWKWDYYFHLEYHESPAIQIAAILETVMVILALLVGLAITVKLIGAGDIKDIVQAPFMGMAAVFILGIGFVVAMSWLEPRFRAQMSMPKVPLMPRAEVGVGPAPAAERRRRR